MAVGRWRLAIGSGRWARANRLMLAYELMNVIANGMKWSVAIFKTIVI